MSIRLPAAVAALSLVSAVSAVAQPAGPAGPITLEVQYTPAAAAAVTRNHYPMRVFLTFDGDPVPAHADDVDDMSGTIDLGMSEALPIPATAGRHAVPLAGLDRARLSWVIEARVSTSVAPELTPVQVNRATVADTIICQSPSEMSLAEAVAEPLPVICRTMPETR
jgi:hypothetical protein